MHLLIDKVTMKKWKQHVVRTVWNMSYGRLWKMSVVAMQKSVHFDFSFEYGEIVNLDHYNVNNNL